MTVIEASDYHGPYPGNFIPTLLAVGAAVRERLGLDYVCVFPAEVRERPWVQLLADAGIEAVFVPAGTGTRGATELLRELAQRHRARLIRTHFTRFDLPAALAARGSDVRVLWNIHTATQGYGWRHRARDVVKMRLAGRALCDGVIAVSQDIGREARMRGFPPGRITVILNGIDVTRFSDAQLPDREQARAGLGLDGPAALAYCWWPQVKGADVLAAAGAQLDGATVLMVGRDPLRAFLAEHVGDPLPPWLRVVEPVDDPRVLLAAADVFVSASRQEGLPYAIGEAMAAGLPVVSSDIPGPAPYFPAPDVRTYPVEDAAALAGALREALQAGRSEGNRRFIAEHLGFERHVDEVLALFERRLSEPRRGR